MGLDGGHRPTHLGFWARMGTGTMLPLLTRAKCARPALAVITKPQHGGLRGLGGAPGLPSRASASFWGRPRACTDLAGRPSRPPRTSPGPRPPWSRHFEAPVFSSEGNSQRVCLRAPEPGVWYRASFFKLRGHIQRPALTLNALYIRL